MLTCQMKKSSRKLCGNLLPIKIPPKYKANEEKCLDNVKGSDANLEINTNINAPNIGPSGMFSK